MRAAWLILLMGCAVQHDDDGTMTPMQASCTSQLGLFGSQSEHVAAQVAVGPTTTYACLDLDGSFLRFPELTAGAPAGSGIDIVLVDANLDPITTGEQNHWHDTGGTYLLTWDLVAKVEHVALQITASAPTTADLDLYLVESDD